MADLKILFRCEAAGRKYNEDNGKILQLGNNRGTLLIVCDGMGGMKAGEVASRLAVETIEGWFTPERLTSEVVKDPLGYLKQSIVGADINIKNYSKNHPDSDTEGMGSTVVLTWLLGEKAYVAWCGDSRAYRYNPQLGLERLSHDHSLVQSWVDAGQITEEQAFDHPQSNIITRSLGDPKGVAEPDAAEYTLYNNDVYLLCSDGLCGTLRDSEIEKILSENNDLLQCCEQLWQADKAAGWSDNVTTAMAQVISGGVLLSKTTLDVADASGLEIVEDSFSHGRRVTTVGKILRYVFEVLLILCVLLLAYLYYGPKHDSQSEQPGEEMSIPSNEESQEPSRSIPAIEKTMPDTAAKRRMMEDPSLSSNKNEVKKIEHSSPATVSPPASPSQGQEPKASMVDPNVGKQNADSPAKDMTQGGGTEHPEKADKNSSSEESTPQTTSKKQEEGNTGRAI